MCMRFAPAQQSEPGIPNAASLGDLRFVLIVPAVVLVSGI